MPIIRNNSSADRTDWVRRVSVATGPNQVTPTSRSTVLDTKYLCCDPHQPASVGESMRLRLNITDLPISLILPIGFTTPVTPITVNWGDGNEEIFTSGPVSHKYDVSGEIFIDIYGKADSFGNGINSFSNSNQVTGVIRWGDLGFKSLSGACNSTRVTSVPSTIPDTVTDLSFMFTDTGNFNQDLSGWDTSNVTDMMGMFYDSNFNGNISTWDTGNVQYMDGMFGQTVSFNGNITLWDTKNVISMSNMFNRAYAFNQDLSWNTVNVTDMTRMFDTASIFDQYLNEWNVSNVTNAENIFCDCPNMLGFTGKYPVFSPEPSNYGCPP